MNKQKLSVILPCFNEEENIKRIPEELLPILKNLGMDFEVIIVDDGSKDYSVTEALKIITNEPRIKLIKHPQNMGAGAAFQTGFQNAESDLLITMDADFTFSPKLIPLLLKTLKENPNIDFVSGSPVLGGYGKDVQLWRVVISKTINMIYSFLLGQKTTAVTPFFRLYKTEQIKSVPLDSRGFEICSEILFKMAFSGKKFIEAPTPLTKRIHGISHLNYKKEIINHIRLLLKIIKWKFFGFK